MKKVNLAGFDNSWYQPSDWTSRVAWYFTNAIFFRSSIPWPSRCKILILRLFGAKVGKGVILKPRVNIKYPWFLEAGNNVWFGEDVWIDNLGMVKIGNNVCLSQGALLLCGNHNFTKEFFDLIVGEIILEEGVWVGAKAVVCPGVTMNSHSILTVGSILTQNTETNGIYKGNPAVLVKRRQIY